MSISPNVVVIVNKDGSELAPSETFIAAHINNLPCRVSSLIGNPGYRVFRRASSDVGSYLASRALLPLAYRWGFRRVTGQSVATQDSETLRRFLLRHQIDAVLAEYGPTAVSVMDSCRRASVPLIAHFHGYDAYRDSLLDEMRLPYATLFTQAAAVIGVSTHMCSQLESLGAPQKKLFQNACGAEIPPEVHGSPAERPPRFLMVGRLVEKKAPFVALLAFAELARALPNARLEIVGDGPLKGSCIQLARTLRITEQVTFSGAMPHTYVMDAMKRVRGFIQHSVQAPDGDMEGTPVAILEAMGMGLPVVATRHGGIRDVIEHGETGLLVDEYDSISMAAELKLIATKPDYAQHLGQKARFEVLRKWTSEKSVDRLWSIITRSI